MADLKKVTRPTGRYIIFVDGDEVWSTDSPFWRDFYNGVV